MGRVIEDQNGGGDFNPTAMLREKDATIKGTIAGKRDVKTQYGQCPVYSLAVLDASCRFLLKNVEVQPAEGDVVDFFASTRLARQLAQVGIGETVTIKYVGTKKIGKGQPAHIYDVTVA